MADDWKSLPDVEQPKSDWRSLPDVEPESPEPSFLQNVKDWATGKPHQGKPLGNPDAVVAPGTPEQLEAAKAQTEANELGSRTAAKKALYGNILAGVSFPSLGAVPVVSGAVNAIPRAIGDYMARGRMGAPGPSLGDAYRKERDAAAEAMKSAEEEHPVSRVVGALATAPESAPTALGRLGVGALQMGAQGLFRSRGDLTKGEVGQVAADTGKGALGGLAAAGIGEALGAPFRALMNKGKNLEARGVQTAADRAQAQLEDTIGSAKGALGSSTQKGSRGIEALKYLREEVSPAVQAEIDAARGQPGWQETVDQIAGSKLKEMPGHFAEIAGKRTALDAANAAKATPGVLEQLAQEEIAKGGAPAVASKLAMRLRQGLAGGGGALAGRFVGGEAGELLGGPSWREKGANIGTALGGTVGGALGGMPGQAVANSLKQPGTQIALGKALQGIGGVGGAANEKINNAMRLLIQQWIEKNKQEPNPAKEPQ